MHLYTFSTISSKTIRISYIYDSIVKYVTYIYSLGNYINDTKSHQKIVNEYRQGTALVVV